MPLEFRLPDVGEGIDAAEILEWRVAAGDEVREDQPLVEIQTDKSIVVIPVPTTGTVLELRAAVGDSLPVGQVLAVFEPAAKAAAGALPENSSATAPLLAAAPRRVAAVAANGATTTPAGRPLASPATRKLARDRGVDLAAVSGSGPGGRVLREDVEQAVRGAEPAAPGAAAPVDGHGGTSQPPVQAPAPGSDQVVALKGTRRAIARTLTRAWQEIPHVIDYREVDGTALVALRRALKARAVKAGDEALAKAMTITPLVVKMAAVVLARHPYVNASVDLEREEITLRGNYNIGVAMAAPAGLVVPVVHHADAKTVAEIAIEIASLADAARENRLTPAQFADGTFTVNNYGGLGIWLGTPIIPPPQVANFGIGRMEDRAVVRDGEIVVRPIIPLAVSGDHRILDGHTLAYFVTDMAELMERPDLLVGELR
jgi:pyruvate dehydrogenase E2 component (dihydrolipoamide acetyltransferase)